MKRHGPWDDEPNESAWTTEAGLPAMLRRGPSGAWCGYVRVESSHRLHAKTYSDEIPSPIGLLSQPVGARGILPIFCKAGTNQSETTTLDILFDVHGSVTFAGASDGLRGVKGDGGWWIGFDCNHSGDAAPDATWSSEGVYRTFDYAHAQCESLAKQIVRYDDEMAMRDAGGTP